MAYHPTWVCMMENLHNYYYEKEIRDEIEQKELEEMEFRLRLERELFDEKVKKFENRKLVKKQKS